jgi:hypothetical protein
MKKYFVGLLFVIASITSYSQIEKPNVIKISPLVFVKGQIVEVHYERALFGRFSASLGVAPIYMGELSVFNHDTVPLKGFAFDPEIRWYTKKDGVLEGFFIGFYGSLRYSGSKNNNLPYLTGIDSWNNAVGAVSVDPTYINGDKYTVRKKVSIYGFQLGTQRLFGKWFVFNFYGGAGVGPKNYVSTNNRTDYKITSNGFKFNLRANVSFGVRF